MKVIFSGVTRKERLEILRKARAPSIFIDFSLVKTLSNNEIIKLRSDFAWLGLDFNLSHKFSRIKSLWTDAPSTKLVQTHGGIDQAQTYALKRLNEDVKAYKVWIDRTSLDFDAVVIPRIPVEHSFDWEELLKSQVSMFTLKSIEDLESLIPVHKYVAVDSKCIDEAGLSEIRRCSALLRSFSCHVHVWGRVNKETVLSGAFWSGSSSNWLSGGRYGNTYEYLGNIKMIQHHATKGRGKNTTRSKLKAKCALIGVDHAEFMGDKREVVDLWNAHQYTSFAYDSEKVTGYWSSREDNSLNTITTKELVRPRSIVEYSRTCNSCYVNNQCPFFEEDSSCRLPPTPKVSSPNDIQSLLNQVIQIQSDRVIFSAFAEKVQNAGINSEVSKELETLTKLMKDAREITSPIGSEEVMIRAKGSGIINKLFGGYGKSGGSTKPSMSEKIIDVSPIEDDDE